MFSFPKKALLLCIVAATTVFSTSIQKDHLHTILFGLAHHNSYVSMPQSKALGKKAALVWKQTGTTYYDNSASSDKPVEWIFSERDTTVYDEAGNEVIHKTSRAQSGWNTDSLVSMDTTVYTAGGKTVVKTHFEWDATKSVLEPSYKDSAVYSASFSDEMDNHFLYTNFVGVYHTTFDATGSFRPNDGFSVVKNDSECNATTLVINNQYQNSTNDSSLNLNKSILTFKTTDWSESNLAEVRAQMKNPVSGIYNDYWKIVFTSTGNESYTWDTTAKSWVCDSKDFEFQDSHGKDSLMISCEYDLDKLAWDTSSMYRYARTYDDNGNNLVSVESSFNTSIMSWYASTKEVNTFSRNDVPVVRSLQAPLVPKLSIFSKGKAVRFSAPGVTALNLYSASGRLVASVKQQPSASITLELSNFGRTISTGTYVAELVSKNGKYSSKISIQR